MVLPGIIEKVLYSTRLIGIKLYMLVSGGQMVWLGIILIILAFIIFVNATEKVKYGEFEQPSWLLVSFGIYQWGQALLLAAFWMLFGLSCIFWWTAIQALHAYILFHIVRGMIEIVLMLSGNYRGLADAIAPETSKITPQQRFQLYCLGQGIIILSGLLILFK